MMKESLHPYIDSFLTMISVEKGLAKNTVEAYSRDLSGLAEFHARTEDNLLGCGGADSSSFVRVIFARPQSEQSFDRPTDCHLKAVLSFSANEGLVE